MTKDYVNYETAKMLAELEFPQKINVLDGISYYNQKGIFKGDVVDELKYKTKRSVAAPQLYQAQKFLREEYNCDVIVNKDGNFSMPYQFRVYTPSNVIVSKNYTTYEQALSEGIRHCCKFLITEVLK